jgi:predicted lactoylglutathione lyase
MTKTIFVSLPVTDLDGLDRLLPGPGIPAEPAAFSDDTAACMVWSEAIHVMLLTHAKWRTFTIGQCPARAPGVMLSLSLDSRDAVDAMNLAAAAHGGQADVNPVQDLGFMYGRDLADPDGHLWAAFWMDPAAMAPAVQPG